MPALEFDEHHPLFDPDQLKMPESHDHRQAVEMIALLAESLLGPEYRVFRDMNWYPTDGGNAIAPDLYVLPVDAVPLPSERQPGRPKSYRQDKTGGPTPSVAVEVPSDTDTFAALRTKAARCRRLGVTVYLVVIDSTPPEVLRLAADGSTEQVWNDQPIPELGGLALGFDHDGALTVTSPDGLQATSTHELTNRLRGQADEARRQVEEAQQQAEDAKQQAERLAQQLRDLGVDPDLGGS